MKVINHLHTQHGRKQIHESDATKLLKEMIPSHMPSTLENKAFNKDLIDLT
jgi:hypothetical protein